MFNNKKGFSLIEVSTTVAIIAIISSMGGIYYTEQIKEARAKTVKQYLVLIFSSYRSCALLNYSVSDCDTLDELDVKIGSDHTFKKFIQGNSICFQVNNSRNQFGCYDSRDITSDTEDIMDTSKGKCTPAAQCAN